MPSTFRGFVELPEKLRVLESAHAFALLSYSEGLPMAALEAMAAGTPVVLSQGCHLPEVDGVAGVVVGDDVDEERRRAGGTARGRGAPASRWARAPRRSLTSSGARS